MKSEIEREYERKERWVREVCEKYKQLTPWGKFRFRLFTDWLILQQQIEDLPLNWVKFVLEMERQFEVHGMPYWIKRQLAKWFNYLPQKNAKYFLLNKRKIWYTTFNEDDNFELHLYYRDRFPGFMWLQPEKDGTATIIGIHIEEKFRNAGLGTIAFQETVKQIKNKVTRIKGLLEREYYPDPEPSLRWLRRQGFEIKPKENGDYELELWVK